MKLKGTVAFTLTVWALAAVVANRASAAVITKFLFIVHFLLPAECRCIKKGTVSQAKQTTLRQQMGRACSPNLTSARVRESYFRHDRNSFLGAYSRPDHSRSQ
jgi:hypothetical protein